MPRRFLHSLPILYLGAIAALLLFSIDGFAVTVDAPAVMLNGVPGAIVVTDAEPGGELTLSIGEVRATAVPDAAGRASFDGVVPARSGNVDISVSDSSGRVVATRAQRIIPAWVSILPPALAIGLALLLRSVIPSLYVGIWFGAMSLQGFSPAGALGGILSGFDTYVVNALSDRDHVMIVLFSMMIGGMVGIVSRSGGMAAIVAWLTRFAKTATSAQASIWAMGLAIFVDDYGNTLVVGNTARPLADRLGLSREKLAYIVDSTAAPVSAVAIATTWIGYQVGIIGDSLERLPGLELSPYAVFLNALAYNFYPFLCIVFVLAVALTGRDFGPMLGAERDARRGLPTPGHNDGDSDDDLAPKPGVPPRAVNAIAPILTLIVTLFVGLYVTGSGKTLTDILGSANSYQALMWASLLSVLVAAALLLAQRLMSVTEIVNAWYSGVRAMLIAMIVLVLAWALAEITNELHAADFLIAALGQDLPLFLLPAVVFVLSALTAFATGSSWGTMGILLPLVIPLAWAMLSAANAGAPTDLGILYSAVACNLAGAIWGDHCSPISDTTILSSMASGCDHIEHVRTQLPYALLVGVVAVVGGTIPAALGVPWWLLLPVCAAGLIGLLLVLGRRADSKPQAESATP